MTCRNAPWADVPPESVAIPPACRPAFDTHGVARGAAVIAREEQDYYGFTSLRSGYHKLVARGIDLPKVLLGVFDSAGHRLAHGDGATGSAEVSVWLCAGSRYYLGVAGRQGTGGGSYRWLIESPA